MNGNSPLLEMQNITVMRGERRVLRGITLRIGAGEHVAILGPNGCGKSTLIKTITRECYPLLEPGSEMRLMGRESWNIFQFRAALGIVSNDLMVEHARDISGEETVLSGFFSSVGIWPNHEVTAAMRERAREILDLLESRHLAEVPVNHMSSGEARRVLIGRALVHSPKALLLDEFSTSLDVFAQHEVRTVLRRLAQAGTGIIVVTHHLGDIIPEIERVIFMRDGRVAADGAKERLLAPGPLGELFGLPVSVEVRDRFYHLWN